MLQHIKTMPWAVVLVLCLTLGLAPFSPQPHLLEKLILLKNGQLNSLIDIFDFLMHLSPFILLLIKTTVHWKNSHR